VAILCLLLVTNLSSIAVISKLKSYMDRLEPLQIIFSFIIYGFLNSWNSLSMRLSWNCCMWPVFQ